MRHNEHYKTILFLLIAFTFSVYGMQTTTNVSFEPKQKNTSRVILISKEKEQLSLSFDAACQSSLLKKLLATTHQSHIINLPLIKKSVLAVISLLLENGNVQRNNIILSFIQKNKTHTVYALNSAAIYLDIQDKITYNYPSNLSLFLQNNENSHFIELRSSMNLHYNITNIGDKIIIPSTNRLTVFAVATGKILTILKGHTDLITCLNSWNDKVISGSWDRTLKIWDLTTGEGIQIHKLHTDIIWCLETAYNKLISGSEDKKIIVYDLENKKILHLLKGHTDSVNCLKIMGNNLISSSKDCLVRVWDLNTGDCIKVLDDLHTRSVNYLKPTKDKLISSSSAQTILWDINNFKHLHTFKHDVRPYGKMVTIDNVLIAIDWDDVTCMRAWDLITYECVQVFNGHEDEITDFIILGNTLISSSKDKTIRIWDIKTAECLTILYGHFDAIKRLALFKNKLISISDESVRIWNITNAPEEKSFNEFLKNPPLPIASVIHKLSTNSHKIFLSIVEIKILNEFYETIRQNYGYNALKAIKQELRKHYV